MATYSSKNMLRDTVKGATNSNLSEYSRGGKKSEFQDLCNFLQIIQREIIDSSLQILFGS